MLAAPLVGVILVDLFGLHMKAGYNALAQIFDELELVIRQPRFAILSVRWPRLLDWTS